MRPNSDPRYNKLGAVNDDTENPNPNGDYPNANSNYNAYSKGPDLDEKCDAVVVVASFFSVIGGMIALTVWLAYHPDFPDISISSFEVSGFDVSIAIRNPNKVTGISCEDVKAVVLYSTDDADRTVLDTDDFVIAKTLMFPFSQGQS